MSISTSKSKLAELCFLCLTIWASTFARIVAAVPFNVQNSIRRARNKHGGTGSNPSRPRDLSPSPYPTEYTCINDDYESIVDVTYSYSIETTLYTYKEDMTMAKYIEGIIANFEAELLFKLSEELLSCNDDRRVLTLQDEHNINVADLGIVEISSNPKDEPSLLSRCTSAYNDCTVIHGSLTILLETDQYLPHVRYAALSIINDSMANEYFTTSPAPRVDNLLNISYRGPAIISPENSSGGGDTNLNTFVDVTSTSSSIDNGGGITTSGLLMATLVSTVVGFFAAFILFKKINSKQNCMAVCDGSGIDRDFMESQAQSLPVLPLSPGGHQAFGDEEDEDEEGDEGDDVQVFHYDIANGGLSAIAETLDMNETDTDASFASSFALSTTTDQTSMSRSVVDGSGRADSESICSERTTRTSNRALTARPKGLSTPHFGKSDLHII